MKQDTNILRRYQENSLVIFFHHQVIKGENKGKYRLWTSLSCPLSFDLLSGLYWTSMVTEVPHWESTIEADCLVADLMLIPHTSSSWSPTHSPTYKKQTCTKLMLCYMMVRGAYPHLPIYSFYIYYLFTTVSECYSLWWDNFISFCFYKGDSLRAKKLSKKIIYCVCV